MDQLKDFLRQCVKYRFWIAFGVSLLLPMIGYFVGSGAIVQATTTREGEIKGASSEVGKYRSGAVVNAQYTPLAAQKKEVLTKDVDTTWRKLYANQAPLLRWPEDVEARFRKWGRKFPSDVDKGQVQATIIDYTISYPNFVSKVYKTFKPFNFDDGSGIVVAPDEKVLLRPAPFSPDAPPELGKVWAEQERIWVVTALLDVVAKVNDSANAKDWDGAIVKQINLIEVGSQADQDQKSIAKNETLVPADPLLPDGVTAPAPAAPTASPMEKMMGGGGTAGNTPTDEVFYIKTEGQQYKILPIKMTVLVEQAKLPDFLVALENSPMTIQLKEAEIAKPLTPVMKPAYGERSSFNMAGMSGSGMNMPGMNESSMAAMMRMQGSRGMTGSAGMAPGAGNEAMMRMMMGGGGGAAPATKKGTDVRGVNKADERKKTAKEANKPKAEAKKIDQYFNVIEVTVYGQARFYSAPPPLPEPPPSTAAPAAPAAPGPAQAEAPKAAQAEAPKAEEPAKKEEAPKKDETPKPEASKTEAPANKPEEPKADSTKSDAPKGEATKPDGAKPEAPKTDPASPKR